MNREIAWEKWEDDIVDEIQLDTEEDLQDSESTGDNSALTNINIPQVVLTSLGMYAIHDRTRPSYQFDCWVGHTNFDITDTIKKQIEKIEGVEALSILTRYRFFVGVAKMFDFKETRIEIERTICGKHQTDKNELNLSRDVKNSVDKIKSKLSSKKFWAIFIFPNGRINYVSTNDRNDRKYSRTLRLYKEAKEHSGGVLLLKEQPENGV